MGQLGFCLPPAARAAQELAGVTPRARIPAALPGAPGAPSLERMFWAERAQRLQRRELEEAQAALKAQVPPRG